MAIPTISAIFVDRKQVSKQTIDTLAFIITVVKKKPLEDVPHHERIPRVLAGTLASGKNYSIPTDVLTGPFVEDMGGSHVMGSSGIKVAKRTYFPLAQESD